MVTRISIPFYHFVNEVKLTNYIYNHRLVCCFVRKIHERAKGLKFQLCVENRRHFCVSPSHKRPRKRFNVDATLRSCIAFTFSSCNKQKKCTFGWYVRFYFEHTQEVFLLLNLSASRSIDGSSRTNEYPKTISMIETPAREKTISSIWFSERFQS